MVAAATAVRTRIEAACTRVGRDPREVTLVAVTKTVDAARARAAVAAGLTVLGENRVQEAAAKVPEVPGATWHLIGPLQSNKVRSALTLFDVIQSVDSIALAQRLDRVARDVRGAGPARRFGILLQVNVDDDPAKAGFAPTELADTLDVLRGCDALSVDGLMTIGRLVDAPEAARPTFRALRALSDRHRPGGGLGPHLSMGMSDDFDVAVEEGATIVRVGRALFGERPRVDVAG